MVSYPIDHSSLTEKIVTAPTGYINIPDEFIAHFQSLYQRFL
jgi:hypothetical protein